MSIFGNKNLLSFSIERVMELLPHRYPFLLIDKVESLDIEAKTIVAIKNVTINEPFFQGHFPQKPIMPGVLIVEAMAQAAGICALESDKNLQAGNLFFFLSIENAKFRLPVVPGDTLKIEAKLVKSRGPLSKFECFAYVEGKLVTEATLTAKVMI
jgi:3-hydroxyacyl-[acyl-carrier-protein] dehydratase